MYILLFLLASCNAYYLNNWFPVLSLSTSDFTHPKQVRVLGKDFVVWKKDEKLMIQDDVCAHRCAPLSEGYIDRESKNLRCAYHGWEFNEKGGCTTIPQLDSGEINSKKACIRNYPTEQYGDLLWMYLGSETVIPDLKKTYSIAPSTTMFSRILPYGFYILLENFFDPAHIPFAHHKLQSVRSAASPIGMKVISEKNDTNKLSIQFENKDIIERIAIMNFEMPGHYYLETIKPKISFLKGLHLFMVPVEEDKTLLFTGYHFNEEDFKYKIFTSIPFWMRHLLTNRFLDSDTLILHKQEQYLKMHNESYHHNSQYYMPTESDLSIRSYQNWIRKALPKIPFFYKRKITRELTRSEILDRYTQHTRDCKFCSGALKNGKRIQKYGTLFWISCFGVFKNPFLIILAFINYYILEKFKHYFLFHDYVHNKID